MHVVWLWLVVCAVIAPCDVAMAEMDLRLAEAFREMRFSEPVAYEEFEALLDDGANPNGVDELDEPVFFDAVWRDPTGRLARLFIERGADAKMRGPRGNTAMFRARDARTIRALLEAGASVDAQNEDGVTPLMKAATSGNPELIQVLIAVGADLELRDRQGQTALIVASRYWLHGMRELLEAGANANAVDIEGWTPLLRTLSHPQTPTDLRTQKVLSLLEYGADPNVIGPKGIDALLIASVKGESEVVSMLIATGASPDRRDSKGRTALHLAAITGDFIRTRAWARETGLGDFAFEDRLKRVRWHWGAEEALSTMTALVVGGADVNALDEAGRTALDHAQGVGRWRDIDVDEAVDVEKIRPRVGSRERVDLLVSYGGKSGDEVRREAAE